MLGPSTENVILALAVVYIPRTARIVRASVLVLRESEFVQAAVAAGAGHWRMLRTHVLPNAMAPLIVQLSFLFAYAVLTEATLSFLGLGAVPPTPTWGNIMAEGRQYMQRSALDHHHPRHAADDDGDGPQPARRRPARRAGPALAAAALSLLEIDDLTVAFRTERGEVTAVEEVSLALEPGEILGIVGESGSGKSVTALTVMGLLPEPAARVTAGAVRFEGQELTALSELRMQRVRGPGIAMVFQEPMTSLNPVFSIGEQITETLAAHGEGNRAARRDRAVEMLERVGIPSASRRLGDYPHQLSGGQRQRVMIAMALACRPRLLIADEPTTALDVTIQAGILDLLLDLRDELGMAVVLITHNMGVIAEAADRVAVMYAGRVVEQAPVAKLFAAPEPPLHARPARLRAHPGRRPPAPRGDPRHLARPARPPARLPLRPALPAAHPRLRRRATPAPAARTRARRRLHPHRILPLPLAGEGRGEGG